MEKNIKFWEQYVNILPCAKEEIKKINKQLKIKRKKLSKGE